MTNPKASFNECYTTYSPRLYADLLLQQLNYRLPFEAMRLLTEYLRHIDLPDTLEIVFLGSGHGLESAALKYGYTCEDILRYWLSEHPDEHLFAGGDPRFKVTMIDINEAPLRFAYDVGLSDRFFCCDIRKELSEELNVFLAEKTDLLMCVGATTYIGIDGFDRLVRITENGNIKYFCFSLPSFISSSYLEIFKQSSLKLYKLGDVKQRNYKDHDEESRILENLRIQNKLSAEDHHGLMASLFVASKLQFTSE